jgi:hypothetical protein
VEGGHAQARNAATACQVIGRYRDTVSPFFTPKPVSTFASAHTSRSSSRYVIERPSPGSSASQMIAVCAHTSAARSRVIGADADLVGMRERPAVDAVVRRVEPALGEPDDVAVLEPARADGLEVAVPVQRLARDLRARGVNSWLDQTRSGRTLAHQASESSPTVSRCAARYASWSGPTCGFLWPLARRGATGCLGTDGVSAIVVGRVEEGAAGPAAAANRTESVYIPRMRPIAMIWQLCRWRACSQQIDALGDPLLIKIHCLPIGAVLARHLT